jgi:hypothetical protein
MFVPFDVFVEVLEENGIVLDTKEDYVLLKR